MPNVPIASVFADMLNTTGSSGCWALELSCLWGNVSWGWCLTGSEYLVSVGCQGSLLPLYDTGNPHSVTLSTTFGGRNRKEHSHQLLETDRKSFWLWVSSDFSTKIVNNFQSRGSRSTKRTHTQKYIQQLGERGLGCLVAWLAQTETHLSSAPTLTQRERTRTPKKQQDVVMRPCQWKNKHVCCTKSWSGLVWSNTSALMDLNFHLDQVNQLVDHHHPDRVPGLANGHHDYKYQQLSTHFPEKVAWCTVCKVVKSRWYWHAPNIIPDRLLIIS